MNSGAARPFGRERRRKDPIGRLRRFLYGLLLLAAAPGAAAVDSLAEYGKYRIEPVSQKQQHAALATLQGLLVLRAGTDNAPDPTLDTVTVQIPVGAAGESPQFRITAARNVRPEGVDF